MSAGCSRVDGVNVSANGAATAPIRLKHLSTQPATEPHPSDFFSQGLPFGQQSAGAAANEASCGIARAIPPAIGSRPTANATRAIKMVRPALMLNATLCA